MEYKAVVLAGLLHEIGRLLIFGSWKNSKGKDAREVSVEFIQTYKKTFDRVSESKFLTNIIKDGNDNNDNNVKILSKLLNKSSYYSLPEYEKNNKVSLKPLDSIFSRLEFRKKNTGIKQYNLKEYSPEYAFPFEIDKCNENDANNHVKSFIEEFENSIAETENFEVLYCQFYSLLMKYAWCIPARSQSIIDISLFDHLKVTSAISAATYKYYEQEKCLKVENIEDDEIDRYCLLVGDVSGIQSYLFSGASIGTGGVAKRLRARSFAISIMSEMIAHRIIKDYNLPITNILMSSGGNFYILLPKLKCIDKRLKDYQKKLDYEMMKEYQGELAMNLAVKPLSGKNFKSFGKVLKDTNFNLGLKKKMPFENVLKNNEGWEEERFIFYTEERKGLGICKGCSREFAVSMVNEREYGEKCIKDIKLGKKIPRIKGLQLIESDRCELTTDRTLGVNLVTDNYKTSKNDLFISLNNNKLEKSQPILFKQLANYIPTKDKTAITFEEISGKSKGAKRLGYLKADVDNLGSLFAFGLKTNGASYDSIARITTMSRMLDLFFSGQVNNLLSNEFKKCYTVFSGGDDLLIIGPWNEIIELSIKIQSEFTKFTGSNKNITLSAGISIGKTKSPVAKLAEKAEDLLKDSKEKVIAYKNESKNQLTIFGETLSWENFNEAVKDGKKLLNWIEEKKISKSFLWKLKKYSAMYKDFNENSNIEGLKYKPLLAYDIGRLKNERRIDNEIIDWLKELFDLLNPRIKNLSVITEYALYGLREGE